MYVDLVKVLNDHFSLKLSEIVKDSKFCDCSRNQMSQNQHLWQNCI